MWSDIGLLILRLVLGLILAGHGARNGAASGGESAQRTGGRARLAGGWGAHLATAACESRRLPFSSSMIGFACLAM